MYFVYLLHRLHIFHLHARRYFFSCPKFISPIHNSLQPFRPMCGRDRVVHLAFPSFTVTLAKRSRRSPTTNADRPGLGWGGCECGSAHLLEELEFDIFVEVAPFIRADAIEPGVASCQFKGRAVSPTQCGGRVIDIPQGLLTPIDQQWQAEDELERVLVCMILGNLLVDLEHRVDERGGPLNREPLGKDIADHVIVIAWKVEPVIPPAAKRRVGELMSL